MLRAPSRSATPDLSLPIPGDALRMNVWIADAVLVLHFGIAAFITLGMVAIPLGAALGWRWVRMRSVRLMHLGAVAFVAFEAVLGIACPLTLMEDALRGAVDTDAGFVQRWLGRILYWDFPAWVFTATYVLLALLAWLLWHGVPPDRAQARPD